jgi:hypothetical protein
MIGATLSRMQRGLQAYLGLIQFLFLLTWVVYVIFLEGMLVKLGLPKEFVPRLLLLDQLVFAFADVGLGFFADRALRLWGRIAPLLVTLNVLSCAAFVALPFVPAGASWLFIGMTIFWVITASVLRAPLYGLIARRASQPAYGTAGALLGMGVASAMAPYLGQALKGIDPILPFALCGVSLAVASVAFGGFESRLREEKTATGMTAPPRARGLFRLLAMALLLGLGMQLSVFVNAAPLYKGVADASLLPWVLPVFWIGFSVAVFPGARLIDRQGARRTLVFSALAGSLATAACLYGAGLTTLLILQSVAGVAWGMLFLSGLTLAGAMGNIGREALFAGAWFACLAVGAMIRIGLGLAGVGFASQFTLPLAAVLWLAGAALAVPWLRQTD